MYSGVSVLCTVVYSGLQYMHYRQSHCRWESDKNALVAPLGERTRERRGEGREEREKSEDKFKGEHVNKMKKN